MKPSFARRSAILGIIGVGAAVAGCGTDSADPPPPTTPPPCTSDIGIPPIRIRVLDAVTQSPIAMATGIATFQDMVTRYELRWNPDLAWLQIDVVPREGLYSIVVRAPGYQDWVRERVQYLPAPTAEVPCPKWLELVTEMTRP